MYIYIIKLNDMKQQQTTPFQQALMQVSNGELKTPTVSTSDGNMDYFGYQLAVHKYNLGLMAIGLTFRNIKFTDIKKYYGLKGRTAKECLPQLERLIECYKNTLYLN